MMGAKIIVGIVVFIALLFAAAIALGRSQTHVDTSAIVQFQRAADDYAFLHRQVERKLGDDTARARIAIAIRTARPVAADGGIFTPQIAAVLRSRIAAALQHPGCSVSNDSNVVPRPNDDAGGSPPVPACIGAALPKLPPELEFRVAGVAMLLVDAHANLVVDVVHGAFPLR